MASGAEILLQLDHGRAAEVAREAADVLDVRATPAEHRLVIVAHGEDLTVVLGHQPEPAVLDGVHVLVLVGQQAGEAAGETQSALLVASHGYRRPEQQVAEVGGVGLAQAALVLRIDAGRGAQPGGIGQRVGCQHRLGPDDRLTGGDEVVLEAADVAGNGLHRVLGHAVVLAGVGAHGLHGALQQTLGIVGIEHVEALAQPGHLRLLAQLAGSEAVEGADPGWRRLPSEKGNDALAHLAGRLVGEGHGQDALRRDATFGDAQGDAGGQGLGLAGPGPRQHQHRPVHAGGFALGAGQPSHQAGTVQGYGSVRCDRHGSSIRGRAPERLLGRRRGRG